MDKNSRLEYMKRRFTVLRDQSDAVLSVTGDDIKDELGLMESVREHTRDNHTDHEELTSDARS